MAEILLTDATMTVRFRGIERIFLGRSQLDIPTQALRHIEPLPQPLRAARGGHAGFLVSGLCKIGYWGTGTGVKQLVCATRGSGLRIVLDKHTARCKYDELILSHPDSENLTESLSRSALRR